MALKKPSEQVRNAVQQGLPGLCLMALSCLVMASPVSAKAQLSPAQARKLISGMPGLDIKSGTVHVSSVRSNDAATVDASAEIAMAFRLEQVSDGLWRVLEFRTGQDQWQGVEFIKRALKIEGTASPCDPPATDEVRQKSVNLVNKRARCLIADLLGIQLPSDDVRIKSISSMALPFTSKPSAMVEATITAEFRFQRESKGSSWRVASFKTGNRDWVDPAAILASVNQVKAAAAQADLASIAKALEAFRAQRGFYVESKSEGALIDFLAPVYLTQVIRLDPWRHPYQYEGTRDHFSLRSNGPDGKENTGDDIGLSSTTPLTVRAGLGYNHLALREPSKM